MPLLSSPGVGSGLDVRGIVDKLMTVERAPVIRLDTRNVELNAHLSAYGSLKSAVSTFRDAVGKLSDLTKFKVYAATASDKDVLDTTASSSAARGTYNLVVNRIAENQRMAAGTSFADSGSTTVGALGDTLTITVGSNPFTVDIGGKTLSQVRDAINTAANNTGVTASILKDNTGYRISLSANETGSAKALSVAYSGTDPFAFTTLNTDRDGSGGFTSADLDASVRLEGQFDITSSSNTLTDTIEGVTLNLKKAGTVTINVNRDTNAVQASVRGFVKAYSDLLGTMNKMRGDILKSDSSVLLNLESQLRAVLNSASATDSKFANVFEVGLSTQKSGTLELNSKILDTALNSDFDGVASLFADPAQGIAKQLSALADSFLATGGALDGQTQGLTNEMKLNQNKKAQLNEHLRQIELRYTQEFGALDSLVSSLTQSGNALTQQLTAITNISSRR